MKEPRPMQEVHEIQENIYNEGKKMSPEKKLDSIHHEAEKVIKEFGLRLPIRRLHTIEKAA